MRTQAQLAPSCLLPTGAAYQIPATTPPTNTITTPTNNKNICSIYMFEKCIICDNLGNRLTSDEISQIFKVKKSVLVNNSEQSEFFGY